MSRWGEAFRRMRGTRRAVALVTGVFALLLQAGCNGRQDMSRGSSDDALPEARIVHGSFEIEASVKRISTGAFPNTSGNPFETRPVSEYRVRFKGQRVATRSGTDRFWRVLRLTDAPRPTLLLVTTGFTMVSEDASGQLQEQAIVSESSSLAEVQWLDARDGQPGEPQDFGIEAVKELEAGTTLRGGRWLRLGSRSVLDVTTLELHKVDPWVPMLPGVPVTAVSRSGDTVRAFSPDRRRYVLAGSGTDYDSPARGQAWGLLEVDIASGITREIRFDRRRLRFIEHEDIDAAWIAHHFAWRPDAKGHDQLVLRPQFKPWPWRARLIPMNGSWQLDIKRIDGAFLPVVKRLAQALPGARVRDDDKSWGAGAVIELGGCTLQAREFGRDGSLADDHRIGIWPGSDARGMPIAAPEGACESALRQLAAAIDQELATGRHDALLKMGD